MAMRSRWRRKKRREKYRVGEPTVLNNGVTVESKTPCKACV